MTIVDTLAERSVWLDVRRRRVWFLLAVATYVLAGFLLAPLLIKHLLTGPVAETLGRTVSIAEVRVNPLLLRVELDGLGVTDIDGVSLLDVEAVHVDLQLSSLPRRAWTLSELTVRGPRILFERLDAETSRLSRLLADLPSAETPEAAASEAAPPRLLIEQLSVIDGQVRFIDRVVNGNAAAPFDIVVAPVNLSMAGVSTLPDRDGTQTFSARLPDGGEVALQGALQLIPLRASGHIRSRDLNPALTIAYIKSVLAIETLNAPMSTDFDFLVRETADGIVAEVTDFSASVRDVRVVGAGGIGEFLNIEGISLNSASIRYPEATVSVGEVVIDAPVVNVVRTPDGALQLAALLPASADTAELESAEAAPPWTLMLDGLSLRGGRVELLDQTLAAPVSLAVTDIDVQLDAARSETATATLRSLALRLGEGAIRASGRLGGAALFDGELTMDALPLAPLEPYVQSFARIDLIAGTVTAQLAVELTAALKIGGSLQVDGLRMQEADGGDDLLTWRQLRIDRLDVDPAAGLVLDTLTLEEPYFHFIINQDQSTNVSRLLVTEAAEDAAGDADTAAVEVAAADTPTMPVTLERLRIVDGRSDFSDLSLPLPFATLVTRLQGQVTGVSNQGRVTTSIELEGDVGEFGSATVGGTMNLQDPTELLDLEMAFRNLQMADLTPYSASFAGRAIDGGKLDLTLDYRIDQGALSADHRIVMSELELGAASDHPEASSLPLGLAVALLTDANGVIDIDVPVTGNVNDPQFELGGVIWRAFSGLITKVVAAPFSLLGGLVGGDGDEEELGMLSFAAGRSDLRGPELEKVKRLADGLAARPALQVTVQGVASPQLDGAVIRAQLLRERLAVAMDVQPDQVFVDMTTAALHAALEAAAGEAASAAARGSATSVDAAGAAVLDRPVYAAALRDELLAQTELPEAALAQLAEARRSAVLEAFALYGLAEARTGPAAVPNLEPELDSSATSVVMPLQLTAAD